MNVLAVTQVHPVPPDMGGAQRVGPLVRALRTAGHDVTLLSLARPGGSEPLEGNEVFARTPASTLAERLALRARAVLGGPPPWIGDELEPSLASRVASLAPAADVVVLLDDYAAGYVDRVPSRVPVVWDKHHVMAAMASGGTRRPGLAGAFDAWLDPKLLLRFERAADGRAARVVVTSLAEADRYESRYGRRPDVVESGIDLPRLAARKSLNTVGWIGVLDHPPNVLGLQRLVAGGWKPLAAKGFRLVIAGRGPSTEVPTGAGVDFVGYVEDEPAWRDGLAAAVVPLWHGAGVKLKTMSFLASGLPTVTTSVGAEGIEIEDGRHALVADSPEEIGAALLRVLTSPDLAGTLSREGRALVESRYTWDVLGPRFVRVVEEAAR